MEALSRPKNKSFAHRRMMMILFTLPIVAVYTFFFYVPMIRGIFYSLTDWTGISKTYNFIGLENYVKLFSDKRVLNALWFNARYVVMLVICVIAISLGLALALNNLIKGTTFFRSIFFIPAVLSLVTVGLIWNELFLRVLPVIGQALHIDFLSTNLLGKGSTAIYGILLVNVWQGCSIPTVLFIAGLQSVPKELYEAATIDGAKAWDKFRHLTIPFLIPVLNIVLITTVKSGLTVFDYILAMTGGGPAQATESVGYLIYRYAFTDYRFGYSVAVSMILFVIVAIVSFATIKGTSSRQVGE